MQRIGLRAEAGELQFDPAQIIEGGSLFGPARCDLRLATLDLGAALLDPQFRRGQGLDNGGRRFGWNEGGAQHRAFPFGFGLARPQPGAALVEIAALLGQ